MTPAVLIPGTLCDARVFAPMLDGLEGLTAEVRPIADDNVADAAEAVLAHAPPRFFAVGFSLGGFVVLELLRRAPERLFGAVLIASNAHPIQPGSAEKRRAEVAQAREVGLAALIEALWPLYVARERLQDDVLKQTIVAMAEDTGIARFALQAELAVSRPDSRADVKESAVPLLALCGEQDAMSSPERCAVFASGPQSRLIELAGVGHFVPLEAPDAAARAISEWLRECAPCC